MKAASSKNNFLVNDPIWAEDFAPNGEHVERRNSTRYSLR